EDRSRFRLGMSAPEGTSFDAMDNYVNQVAQLIIDSVPERETVLTVTSPSFGGSGAVNSGFGNVRISLPNERDRSQEEIVNMLNRNFQEFNFGRTFARQEATISVQRGIGGLPVAFVLQNINFEKL